jgi:AraC-like DNA-binding protein
MRILAYKENKTHGSFDFPVEAYYINKHHPRYIMPLHWHEEYEIIQIRSGSLQYEIGQEKGTAKAGDILCVNSGDFHAGLPSESEYSCIVFDFNLLMKENNTMASNKLLAPLLNGDIRVSLHLPKDDRDIPLILRRLLETLAEKPLGFELQVQGLLYHLFGSIIQNHYYCKNTASTGNKKRSLPLKNALSLIEKEYSSLITLEQLAHAADMSPKYFCYFFKQMTRYSPIEYLNRHRIEIACYKLMSGQQRITELSYECGFNDLSYFIRVFKNIVGVTPKKYALMHRPVN